MYATYYLCMYFHQQIGESASTYSEKCSYWGLCLPLLSPTAPLWALRCTVEANQNAGHILRYHHTHRTGTEYTGFFYQSPCRNTVGRQKIIHWGEIEFIQLLINLINILDFSKIFGQSYKTLAFQDNKKILR